MKGLILNPANWANDPTFIQKPCNTVTSSVLPLNDIEDCSYLDGNEVLVSTGPGFIV